MPLEGYNIFCFSPIKSVIRNGIPDITKFYLNKMTIVRRYQRDLVKVAVAIGINA